MILGGFRVPFLSLSRFNKTLEGLIGGYMSEGRGFGGVLSTGSRIKGRSGSEEIAANGRKT